MPTPRAVGKPHPRHLELGVAAERWSREGPVQTVLQTTQNCGSGGPIFSCSGPLRAVRSATSCPDDRPIGDARGGQMPWDSRLPLLLVLLALLLLAGVGRGRTRASRAARFALATSMVLLGLAVGAAAYLGKAGDFSTFVSDNASFCDWAFAVGLTALFIAIYRKVKVPVKEAGGTQTSRQQEVKSEERQREAAPAGAPGSPSHGGTRECPVCHGLKLLERRCTACAGSGELRCHNSVCRGGTVHSPYVQGYTWACPTCKGKAFVRCGCNGGTYSEYCPRCKGKGRVAD